MCKLLKRAKVDLENARDNFRKIGDDDAYLDCCCFQVQQAIEKTVKYVVEMRGGNYVQNHDIRANLNKLRNMESPLPDRLDNTLRLKAPLLIEWETGSRYEGDFFVDARELSEMIALAEKTIEYADGLVMEIESDIREEEEDY